jgi:hypothetical protein
VNDAATPIAEANHPTRRRATVVERWARCGGAFARRRRRFRRPSSLPIQLRSVLLLLASLSCICTGGCGGDSASPIEGRYVLDREATKALLGQDLETARDSAHRDDIEKLMTNIDGLEKWEVVLEAGGAEVTRPDGETIRGSWRRLGDAGRVELVFDGESKVAEVDDGRLLIDMGSAGKPLRWLFIRAEPS